MWTLVTEGYPEFVAYAAEEYKKTHPDVNIIYENFPNEAYKTQIQVALTGSEPPDVFFNWAGEDAARLVREGLALDITDLGNAEGGFRHSLSDSWQSSFMYEGKNYGVPTDAVSKYFYYDKAFFADNDLTPPTTFDGLLQLCRDIRAIDPALVPWPLGNSERWKLNHVITMLNERVLGAGGDRGRLCADRARRPALHQPRLRRGLAEGARPQGRRLLAGRAERHLAGGDPVDVRRPGLADDLLRHLVRGRSSRPRASTTSPCSASPRSRAARAIPAPASWCRRA